MYKRYLIVIMIVAILGTCAVLWYFKAFPTDGQGQSADNSLPVYNEALSLRITGQVASGLGDDDLSQLMTLSEMVGLILYDVDGDRQPDDPREWLSGATPQYLRSLTAAYQVSSSLLESTLLDIRMEEPDIGDVLVCYRLDFESNQKERGEYLFLVNLHVSRTKSGWICNEAASRGSALAMEYTLSRDDLSGNIRLKPITEEE